MLWFISIRYLLAHLRQSLVCVAGVTIGVMMFLLMSAMMNGFRDKFIVETVESSGHITIHDEPREARTQILQQAYGTAPGVLVLEGSKPREQVKRIKNAVGIIGQLRRMPGIRDASPVVQGGGIAKYGTKDWNVVLFGIDPEAHLRVTTVGTNIVEGDFARLSRTANGIVLGSGVADNLGVKLDDSILVTSSTGGQALCKVVGIFQTGVTPVDLSRGYMLINDAQTLLDRKNIVNQIVLRTDDYDQAREIAAGIEAVVGYKAESWQEANANFLKIFKIQDMITYVITGSLMIVAAFGVLNILIMAVMERINDIAILKSFGLSRGDITKVYVFQGLVIGLIGGVTGVLLGKLAIEGLRRIPIKMEGLVKADGLLMSESTSQYVTAFVAAIVLVLIAAVYPARRAAKYDPVEVIRGAH
jgi:lipoprotein-releasing system permease protein